MSIPANIILAAFSSGPQRPKSSSHFNQFTRFFWNYTGRSLFGTIGFSAGVETESQSVLTQMRFHLKAARMSSVVSQALPLKLLAAGERGVVVDVDGCPNLVVRLQEMGLHPGVPVCMIRPGSPCILEINHQRFSIRFDDSITVLVDVDR